MLKHLYLILIVLDFHHSIAQTTGQFSGRVLDQQTQLPIPGVTVLLEGTVIGVVTNDEGYFSFEDIPPRTYNLVVRHLGYQSQTVFNIIVKTFGTPPLQILMEESSDALDEIVVFQSPFRTSIETPLSTQTFSAVEIETYPGGNNDITKVIQSMPGISPSIGGFRNDIIIRGGAPNESVYYLDGIEIPNINHFSTQGSAGGPVGMLNVSFIREVTLSSSAFGAEYDNPLSGVLSFEQRSGNPNRFGGNFRLGASEAALTLEGPLFRKDKEKPAKTTLLFSVRRSYLQFLFELIGLPIRPDYWDFQWKVNHEIDAYNTLTFLGLGTVDDFSVKAPDDFDAEQQATIEQVPIIEQKTITVGVSWNRKYKNGKGAMTTAISTNRLQNIFSRYRDNTQKTGIIFKNDSYEQETKLRYQTLHYLNEWKLAAGTNIQYADYFNDTQSILYNINYSTGIDFLKYGFFAKGERKFFDDNLGLSFGFRFDADTFSEGSSLMDNFSPRLSLTYNLTEDQTWKMNASVGRYYKIPTYTMLGYQDNLRTFINQKAKYTQSDHFVMGIEYAPGNASRVTLEGFYKKYSQYPISLIDGVSIANKGGDFEVLGNEAIATDGRGKSYGIEALYQQKLTKNFYGVFAYTYFHSQFTTANGDYLPSVWDSRNLISFSGGYKLKRNWEISARWRFSGKTPYVPVDQIASLSAYPEIVLDYNQLGNVKLDPFNLADIRFDKKWNFKRYAFNFYFEIQNFLAQAVPRPEEYGLNRSETGALILPRSLVKVNTDENNNIPIPTFGFVVDF
ncbi:MAG: TonB-dependent receptor [Flavobacteriaceae bacterium]|nr:TonB-dependent receptor [Flavobacteriaceae bacterium]